jgi:hypothetical protein
MASKILYATRDAIIWAGGGGNGAGKDPHNVAGDLSGDVYTLIDFEALPSGIVGLSSARLVMKRSTAPIHANHGTPANGAQLIPGRITADWSEGLKGSDHFFYANNAVIWPGPAVTGELSARGTQPASGSWSIDVQEIVQAWINGQPKKGIRLRSATNAEVIFDSVEGPTKPYLELVWATNRPPNAPTDLVVTPGVDGTSFTVTGKYTDPDGDISTKYEVIFIPDTSD